MRNPSSKHAAGFSLLEVLVAVVLLATGLLALAALQGSLARSSAEAKVRSRIVALMSAEMDNVRSLPYTNLVSAAKVESTNPDCAAPANDVELAGCEAALGYVSLTRTVTPFGANAGNTTFVEGAAPVGSSEAEFRNVVVEVQWRDRNNDLQTLRTRTVVSSLALDSNSPIVDDESANHDPQKPVVRQASPVTAGMIPIALGNGDATAASNPMPEEVGKKGNTKISTRFTVLTYTPESGNLAIIQDRVETEVLKCKCQYGAGGTNLGTIYQQSQWPAIWTGTRYDVYVPENATAAPGQQYRSGPVSSAVQSAMCQECCRDRHDNPADTTNAKFDPEATGGAYQKYDMNSAGQLTNAGNTVSAQYVEACRVIRVDGMWRTAADMYMRQFGYLETETNVYQADTGLPTATATTRYTAYVKDYLSQYDGTVATAPTNAQTMYDDTTRGLNDPATVTIASSTDTKSRFMHARGVYVDYLEKQARETLADALASRRKNGQCLAGSTELADCVLPYLPFSTINVTEFADYESSNTSVIDVHTGGFLPWPTSNLPSRGATEAKGTGTANNRSSMRRSNSGLAATELLANGGIPGATDNLGDDAVGTDLQSFTVGGGTPSGGDSYYIRSTGMTSTSPAYTTTINSSDAKTCISSGTDYICTPTNTIFPGNGTLVLGNYWKQLEPGFSQTKADVLFRGSVCTKSYDNGTKDPLPTFTDQTFNIAVPIFQNYRLVSATMGSGSGTLTPGAPDQDNTTKETTTISILGITKDARIDLVFALENTRTDATPAACNVHYDKQSKTWSGSVSAWNYPWNP